MILLLILLLFVCSQQEKPDLYSILKQADSYGPIYDYDRNVFFIGSIVLVAQK